MKNLLITGLLLALSTTSLFAQIDDGGTGEEDGGRPPAYCENITEEDKGSIIPCGTKYHICIETENAECGFVHLFQLINNMARNFITFVFAPLLTIILLYIGILFIKDQAAAKVKAKELLLRLLIGTFFVLGAWLIVNFILEALGTNPQVQDILQQNN